MENLLSTLLADIMRAKKSDKPTKAYSYLRFSTPEQMSGDSYRRQTELAQRYAAAHGLTLDEELTYRDLGVSGYHGHNAQRGKLAEFLEAVEKGVVPRGSYLLVESLDRISRQNPYDALGVLQRIIDGGVTLVTLMGEPKTYSNRTVRSNPMALMEFLLIATRAHEESATKQRRAKEAWKASLTKVAKRESRGASAGPAWLRPSADGKAWEPVPERVEVVKRIFQLARSGVGKDSIAKQLNTEGVPTFDPKAKQWWGSYIFRILNNRGVIGEHIPKERVHDTDTGTAERVALKPIKGYYPAVLPKKLWEEVRAMQGSNPRRGRHAHAPVANLLGGLALCPSCGGAMTRVNKGGNGPRAWPYLVCCAAKTGKRDGAGNPVCAYKSVGYERVEKALLDHIDEVCADAPEASAKGRTLSRESSNLHHVMGAMDDELENLLELAAKAKGPRPAVLVARIQELETARTEHAKRLEALNAQLRGLDGSLVASRLKELRTEASNPTPDKTTLNGILRRVLSGVVVDYTAGLLRFRWRHADEETELVYAFPEEPARGH